MAHVLAYLNWQRLMAWKRHSIRSEANFAPVAYASRATSFFSQAFRASDGAMSFLPQNPGEDVLWVVATPRDLRSKETAFAPTITACLVVKRFHRGPAIKAMPEEDSVRKIASTFAKRGKKKEDWKSLRVIEADLQESRFFAHFDASKLLAAIKFRSKKHLTELLTSGFTPAQKCEWLAQRLQRPRPIENLPREIAELRTAPPRSVFLSYRAHSADKARSLALALMSCRLHVWLDTLAMPASRARLEVSSNEEGELESVLRRSVEGSDLFVALADKDFLWKKQPYSGFEWIMSASFPRP